MTYIIPIIFIIFVMVVLVILYNNSRNTGTKRPSNGNKKRLLSQETNSSSEIYTLQLPKIQRTDDQPSSSTQTPTSPTIQRTNPTSSSTQTQNSPSFLTTIIPSSNQRPSENNRDFSLLHRIVELIRNHKLENSEKGKYMPVYNIFLEKLIKKGEEILQNNQSESHHLIDDFLRQEQIKDFNTFVKEYLKIHIKQWNEDDILYDINRLNHDTQTNDIVNELISSFPLLNVNEDQILEKINALFTNYQASSNENKQQILNKIKTYLDEMNSISFILHAKIVDLFDKNFLRCNVTLQERNLSNDLTTLFKKVQTELKHHTDIIEKQTSKDISEEIKSKLSTITFPDSTALTDLLETVNASIATMHNIKTQLAENPIIFNDIKDIIETELGNFIDKFNNLSRNILLKDDIPIKKPDFANIEVFWDKTSIKEQFKTILDDIISKANIQLESIIKNIDRRLKTQTSRQELDLQTEVNTMLASVADLGNVNIPNVITQLQQVNQGNTQDNTEIIRALEEIQKMFSKSEAQTPESTFEALSKLEIPPLTHEIFITKDDEKNKLVNVLQKLSKQFIEYKEKQTKKSIPDNLLVIPPDKSGIVEYEVKQFANFQKLSDTLNDIVSMSSSNPIDDNAETLRKISELQNLLKTQIIETEATNKELNNRVVISAQKEALIAKTEAELKKAFKSIIERRNEQQSQMNTQLDLIKTNQENTLENSKENKKEFDSLKSKIAELEMKNYELQLNEISLENQTSDMFIKQSDLLKAEFNKEHNVTIDKLKADNKQLLEQVIQLQTVSNVDKYNAVQETINKTKGEIVGYNIQLGEKNKLILELESKLRTSEINMFQVANSLYNSEYYKNWTEMKTLMEKELRDFNAEKEAIEKKEIELNKQREELDEFYKIAVNEKLEIDKYTADAKKTINQEITAWEETKELLSKELIEYKEKYNLISNELQTAQFSRNAFSIEKQTLEQKNKDLLDKLENFEKESLAKIEKTRKDLQIQLENSNKLNQTLRDTLESKTNQISSKQAQIDAQSQSIASLNSEILKLKNKVETATQQSTEELNKLTLELSAKTSKLELEQTKQKELQRELHLLTDQKSAAQAEVQSLMEKNNSLNTQFKELETLSTKYKTNAEQSKTNASLKQETLDTKLRELDELRDNFHKIQQELIQTKEGQISYLTDEQKELIKASQKLQEYTESLEKKVSKKLNELVSKIKEGLNKTKLLLNIDLPPNVITIHQFIDKIFTYNVQLQINTHNTQFAEQFKSYKKSGNYPLTVEINLGTSSNNVCSDDVLIMQSYLYKQLTPEIKCKLKYDENKDESNNTLEDNYSICIYIRRDIYTGERFVMKKLDKHGKFVDFSESENYDEKYFFSSFKNAYKLLTKEGFNPVLGGGAKELKQKRLLKNTTFEYNKPSTNKYFEYIQNLVMPIYMMKFIKFYFYKHNKNDKTSQIKDYILSLMVIIGLNIIKQIDLSNALTIDFIFTHISYNINKKEESFLIPYFLLYLINI